MWANLTDDVRKAIAAAGPPPSTRYLRDLDDNPEHRDLFFQYFADNCSDPEALNLWSCFWWLNYKDLHQSGYHGDYYAHRMRRTVDVTQFWEAFGPEGASPVTWPAEVTEWFATTAAFDDATEGAWQPAWDAEDDPSGPEWDEYVALRDQESAWLADNPVPLPAAYYHANSMLSGWYTAYADEVSRMGGLAMTYVDLDLDYIASLNEHSLDALAEGDGVPCVGYGPYVLIGEFPPGYVNAVASYDKSWWGTVTMTARGSRFSTGSVTVTGCDGDDQRYFKDAFRKVSKKSIKFE